MSRCRAGRKVMIAAYIRRAQRIAVISRVCIYLYISLRTMCLIGILNDERQISYRILLWTVFKAYTYVCVYPVVAWKYRPLFCQLTNLIVMFTHFRLSYLVK